MGAAFIISLYLGRHNLRGSTNMPIQPAQQLRQRVVDLLFAGCLPTHEDGFSERTIIIEFASVEQAD